MNLTPNWHQGASAADSFALLRSLSSDPQQNARVVAKPFRGGVGKAQDLLDPQHELLCHGIWMTGFRAGKISQLSGMRLTARVPVKAMRNTRSRIADEPVLPTRSYSFLCQM